MTLVIRHVGVVIPARDEAAHISRTLDRVDRARSNLPGDVTSSCVVVADGCIDRTAELARQWRGECSPPMVVETRRIGVGSARAHGVERLLATTGFSPQAVWISNTDADTAVTEEWLVGQLDLANEGVHAVAGIVDLDDDADRRLRDRFVSYYFLDPDGSHAHVHGANLGVRADAYSAVGGWRALTTGEDHDLWRRLRRRHVCVSSTAIVVRTSARLRGRAPSGFAGDLVALDRRTVA